ncbi:MAG TPA: TPM domain-containing protein [Casimicrobiaceae bacterium]|nr:TPM domain-containing protein [Casimicrobiaceae bacterium]
MSAQDRALAFLFAAFAVTAALAADVPYLAGRVVDDAEILRPATREAIAGKLAAHEQKTTNQVTVLTIPTIGDDSIEEFATRVFGTWRLGQRGRDNGVLVVVVPKDRKMRIEVGYGLEGTLTDAGASRIIRNVMTPAFKAGDFDKGVADGVDAIVGQLEGTRDVAKIADVPAPSRSSSGFPMRIDDPSLPPWHVRILLACFIFGIIGLFTFFGIVTPGAGWFLYFFLIPFWAMFPIVILGAQGALVLLIVYLAGFPIAKLALSRTEWYSKARREIRSKGSTTIGGFTVGSGSSGGWSSGGSSSGGFSGGGGSSGGGGASGSW